MSGQVGKGGWLGAFRDGAGDLLLGASCWSCRTPGRAVCVACAAELQAQDLRWAEPDPYPTDFPPTVAAARYDGVAAALIRAHKDDQAWALRPVLAERLAAAVEGLMQEVLPLPDRASRPLLLVPVPSSASAVRRRGYDATGALADHAARLLRRSGAVVSVARLLRQRSGVVDQAGLDAAERAQNVRGRLVARAAGAPARAWTGGLRLPAGEEIVVVVDDVTTTGSTLAEVVRCLAAADRAVHGAATIAATRRWASDARAQDGRSNPF